MAQLNENTWKPVNLRSGGRGADTYTISSQAVSSSWYNRITDNSGTRYNRLLQYNEADNKSVEISRALDIIAEDVSSCNADNQDFFNIDYPKGAKVKKGIINTLETAKDLWSKRTNFDSDFFNHVRRTLKYGATFFLINNDGTLTHLPTERFVGYIISDKDEEKVTHYLYDDSLVRIDGRNRTTTMNLMAGGRTTSKTEKSYTKYSVDDLVVLKIGEGAFGESLIEKVYKTWKQLDMLEEAVLIYRVVRAPERRVYYIETGNLQGSKREQAIERQRMKLLQKRAVGKNGVDVTYDPNSTAEDIFIPTSSSGKGSRIETLPAGQALGELSDLDWFKRKMAAGLRVPNSMTDPQGDQQQQYTDMRVGQAYQIEMRYMGHVKRLKRQIEHSLCKNFKQFCYERGVVFPEEAEFRINDSTSFAEYKDIELYQAQLNVFNSTIQMSALSKKVAMQKYLGLTTEELELNETQKLKELGLDDAQIKALPDSVIDNLVYGNGALGKDNGVPESPEGAGGFGY